MTMPAHRCAQRESLPSDRKLAGALMPVQCHNLAIISAAMNLQVLPITHIEHGLESLCWLQACNWPCASQGDLHIHILLR